MSAPSSDWKRVSFALDCKHADGEDPDEIGSICSICGGEYTECPCPGPTQAGVQYAEFDGVLYGRARR